MPWDESQVRHGYATLREVRLHYVEAGAAGQRRGSEAVEMGLPRPLVILLHGFPEFWYSWRHQIPALAAAGFHVVAPDMRGYNLSDKPHGVGNYRAEIVARDVADLIGFFGAHRASVVGHDWGGGIAWLFAMLYPEQLERLAILNVPHPRRFFRALKTFRQLRKSWYMFFFQLPWLPEWMFRGFNGATLGQTFRRQPARADAFKEEDIERYVAAAQQKGAMTCAINYYRAAFRRHPKQLLAIMRRIDQPVLVIWGERDRFIGRELAQPEPDWVPHARVERLPSASHWVQNDEPEAVNELLVEFLKPVLRDDETRTSG